MKRFKKIVMVAVLAVNVLGAAVPVHAESDLPEYLKECCMQQNPPICYELMESIAMQESSMDFENIDSMTAEQLEYSFFAENGPCKGIFQTDVTLHKDILESLGKTADDIYDPYTAIQVSCIYVTELANQYAGSPAMALMVYSGVPEIRAEKLDRNGEFTSYVREVLERAEKLERLHEQEASYE